MSKRTSYDAAEHARELTADELDQVAGGTPNVTAVMNLSTVGPRERWRT
jgi:hypothetical protein